LYTKPRDCLSERLRNDLFCIKWDVKPRHWICKPAYLVPSQARVKWEDCGRKGIQRKMGGGGDGGGSLISPDGVAPCTIKGQKKISSGTGSPGYSRKKDCKTVTCVRVCMRACMRACDVKP